MKHHQQHATGTRRSLRKGRCRRTLSAFTLIELMVVCGILSVLLTILLPVVMKVRESANKTVCLSNVRQLGAALLLYTQDFDETYPPYFDAAIGDRCRGGVTLVGSKRYWPEIITPYLQGRSGRRSPVTGQARIEDLPSLFICPATIGSTTQPVNYQFGNISSYGISDHIVNWWKPDGCGPLKSHSLSDVVAPTECLLLAESWDWFSPRDNLPGSALVLSPLEDADGHHARTGTGGTTANGAAQTLAGRHDASYVRTDYEIGADPAAINNVFFCDGHAKGLAVGALTASATLWSIRDNGQWP